MSPHRNIKKYLFSRTLRFIAGLATIAAAYAAVCVTIDRAMVDEQGAHPIDLHTSLTLVLGLLLVFRTNAAYDRWWEARVLWGTLVNASRNLAAKLATLPRAPREEVIDAGSLLIAFPYSLRDRLRGVDSTVPPEELGSVNHAPGAIVKRLYQRLADWKRSGAIDGDDLRVLDADAARLLDVCGGCERILGTRIARSYRRFARQCVLLFLATLPWGIARSFGWWTIPLVGVVAYFIIGLEVVAEHVEEPFGFEEDDLDLDGLCDAISQSIEDLLA